MGTTGLPKGPSSYPNSVTCDFSELTIAHVSQTGQGDHFTQIFHRSSLFETLRSTFADVSPGTGLSVPRP